MPQSALTQFVHDPDQAVRRAELIVFFGPNPDSFLTLYRRMAADAATGERRLLSLFGGLCAPAFFLGPIWFFYRKMWLWAWAYCALMLLLSIVPIGGQAGLGLSVAAAIVARWAYLDHAARKMTKLRRTRPADEQAYLAQLAEAGGVSKLAGWLSGVFFATAMALAVYEAFH